MNFPKGHKLEGLILIGKSNSSLRRKGVEVRVYSFFCGVFPGIELFASQSYVCVVDEIPEEFIFGHAEALASNRAVMLPIHGTEAENQIDGINK